MKKFAIGCGVVVLLLGVTAVGIGYYLYRTVSSSLVQFAELAKVPEIERDLRVRDPFTPPPSDELTSAQVERFMRVQARIRTRIGERIAEFEQKYKVLAEQDQANISDFPKILQAYGDLARGWLEAKRSQVEGLNEVSMSLDEYRWIRDQAYRALGVPYVDLDFGRFAEAVKGGGQPPQGVGKLRGSAGPAGPEGNRTLIEPFRKELERNLALASFGL